MSVKEAKVFLFKFQTSTAKCKNINVLYMNQAEEKYA